MKVISFFQEVKEELGKIVWPTKNKVFELTILVLVLSLIVGAYVGSLDFVFTSLMEQIIK